MAEHPTTRDPYHPRILIAASEPTLVHALRTEVQKVGLDCVCDAASSCDEAAAVLAAAAYDLILCDIGIPGTHGFSVLDDIPQQRRPAVILIADQVDDRLAADAARAGYLDVVRRDDPSQLVASVATALLTMQKDQETAQLHSHIDAAHQYAAELQQALLRAQQAEARAKELSRMLTHVFESAPVGIRVVHADGRILRTNQVYLDLADTSQRTTHGGQCTDHRLLCADGCDTDACPLQQILSGTPKVEREVSIPHGGRMRYVDVTSTPLRDGDKDAVVGIIDIARDVTEARVMHQQMLQAQKLESIGQLAAGIAHEINTPTQFVGDNLRFLQESWEQLSALLGHYGELQAACDQAGFASDLCARIAAYTDEIDLEFLEEEIPQALAQGLEGVDRVASIVRAMKEFSHPGSEEAQLFNVNQNIQNTVIVARNEWKYVSRVDLELDPNIPNVRGYPGEFNQTVLNMVVNAAHAIEEKNKATGEKGNITIRTAEEDDWIKVVIADTGCGIPEEIQRKVFDPFFTTKEVGKGTGQGLAIAHRAIVERHNGRIDLRSTPGEGTTFTLWLPTAQSQEASP